ncbi:hypothetical protein DFP72DRAFT_1168988 [Ephemerocybe angulata]|uniref:Uncharacterized protein n=1 Tax=Ephemerocybe angulata TaxID=980116 RepID=A0A8H6I0B4_9AGAR|nr:hypothetical protein DFP72DRAFT_1168988 [Tulosesus angulatus]
MGKLTYLPSTFSTSETPSSTRTYYSKISITMQFIATRFVSVATICITLFAAVTASPLPAPHPSIVEVAGSRRDASKPAKS